jgi:hypothetical protein
MRRLIGGYFGSICSDPVAQKERLRKLKKLKPGKLLCERKHRKRKKQGKDLIPILHSNGFNIYGINGRKLIRVFS